MAGTLDEGHDSSPPKYEEKLPATSSPQLEDGSPVTTIDKETERRLLRKLDIRIIPTVIWIYLMNMMDRGE